MEVRRIKDPKGIQTRGEGWGVGGKSTWTKYAYTLTDCREFYVKSIRAKLFPTTNRGG